MKTFQLISFVCLGLGFGLVDVGWNCSFLETVLVSQSKMEVSHSCNVLDISICLLATGHWPLATPLDVVWEIFFCAEL